jgi:hypothetical protein
MNFMSRIVIKAAATAWTGASRRIGMRYIAQHMKSAGLAFGAWARVQELAGGQAMKWSLVVGHAVAPAILALPLLAGAAGAADSGADCAALFSTKIEDTNLLSSVVVPAKDDLPAYCRVLGYVRPAINFEIRLPTKD